MSRGEGGPWLSPLERLWWPVPSCPQVPLFPGAEGPLMKESVTTGSGFIHEHQLPDPNPTCFSEPLCSLLWLRACHLVYKKRFPVALLAPQCNYVCEASFLEGLAERGRGERGAAASRGSHRLIQLQRISLSPSLWAHSLCRDTHHAPPEVPWSLLPLCLHFLTPHPPPAHRPFPCALTSYPSSLAGTLLSRGNRSPP